MLALAGLPSLPRVLAEAKSYSERLVAFERIQQLAEELAHEALVKPAQNEGVTWEPAAVWHVLNEAEGYPYFLQQFGQGAWNAADGPAITLADAKLGAAIGRNALDAGFFRARWDRATKSEKRYLRAMAADGDLGSPSGEVAFRLGRPINSLGPARANLIAKGLIYAPEHGIVAFMVPGMARFIHEPPEA